MPLDNKILQDLSNNNYVHLSLNLSGKQLDDGDAKKLGEALKTNRFVTYLNLYDNNISDEGIRALGTMLEDNLNIKKLTLGRNEIGEEGANVLGNLLAHNRSLTFLDLWANHISDEGAKKLGESLAKNTKRTGLETLELGNNRIGDEGVKALAKMLTKNHTLTKLSLRHNEIGNEGGKALWESLKKNFSLETLELWGNHQMQQEKPIETVLRYNANLVKSLQNTALKILKAARVIGRVQLASQVESVSSLSQLPLELREHIVKFLDKKGMLTDKQRRLILHYAKGKIGPVWGKSVFFKITKCDRVRKQLNQDEVFAQALANKEMLT